MPSVRINYQNKRTKKPNNFLIIDSREKLPLKFYETEHYQIKNEGMSFGDYGLEINGKLVCSFERKSASDLHGTLTGGHERFKREMQRAAESGVPFFVIVESSYNSILNKTYPEAWRIKEDGESSVKRIHSMQVKYKLPFIFCQSREEMQNYIKRFFEAYIRNYKKITISE